MQRLRRTNVGHVVRRTPTRAVEQGSENHRDAAPVRVRMIERETRSTPPAIVAVGLERVVLLPLGDRAPSVGARP